MRYGVVLPIQSILLIQTLTMLCQGLLELEKQEKNMVFRSQKQEKEHDEEQEQIQNQDQE